MPILILYLIKKLYLELAIEALFCGRFFVWHISSLLFWSTAFFVVRISVIDVPLF